MIIRGLVQQSGGGERTPGLALCQKDQTIGHVLLFLRAILELGGGGRGRVGGIVTLTTSTAIRGRRVGGDGKRDGGLRPKALCALALDNYIVADAVLFLAAYDDFFLLMIMMLMIC